METVDKRMRNRILLVLFVGVLMGALDIAIVGPALHSIQRGFGVDDRAIAWVFSIYVLFNLIGTPLMAKLSDIFGRRAIYVLDVTIFAAGSLLVALSPSFAVLLIGRAVQGLGAVAASQGGGVSGYESAFLVIGGVALIMTLLTLGLKGQADEQATIQRNRQAVSTGAVQSAH